MNRPVERFCSRRANDANAARKMYLSRVYGSIKPIVSRLGSGRPRFSSSGLQSHLLSGPGGSRDGIVGRHCQTSADGASWRREAQAHHDFTEWDPPSFQYRRTRLTLWRIRFVHAREREPFAFASILPASVDVSVWIDAPAPSRGGSSPFGKQRSIPLSYGR